MTDNIAIQKKEERPASRNACKLCTPFGACMAFRGVRGAVPFLHGSQGCATYIRRYMISHFREPIDIASSNFSEESAVFGGQVNIDTGLENVIKQYSPELVGVATTCLAETIGDDVPAMVKNFKRFHPDAPAIVNVSTPSYSGTHAEGYLATIRALVEQLAEGGTRGETVNLIPPMLSAADLRYFREITAAFGIDSILLPDYADTLDGPAWDDYHLIPEGGTPVDRIRAMGRSLATLEMASPAKPANGAGHWLSENYGVANHRITPPIGLRATDTFVRLLEQLSGRPLPAVYENERGRLIDAYVDGHKYLFGRRAVVYGEEDLVVGLVSFLTEIGVKPVLAFTGAKTGRLEARLREVAPEAGDLLAVEGADFEDAIERVRSLEPSLIIGHSKGYRLSRDMNIPLVRVGFPVHDRLGGARLRHVGYGGALELLDRIANALIEHDQANNPWGYTYM